MELGDGKSLLSGFAIPPNGLSRVFGYTVTVEVTNAQAELRRGIALVGGLAQPLQCFSRILSHDIAFDVTKGEIVLRLGVSPLSFDFDLVKHLVGNVGWLGGQRRDGSHQCRQGQQHQAVRLHAARLPGLTRLASAAYIAF